MSRHGIVWASIALIVALVIWFGTRLDSVSGLTEERAGELNVILLPPRDIEPPLNLLDHRGTHFDGSELRDRWTLVFFGFSHCPHFCPATMNTMSDVYSSLETAQSSAADNVNFVLVTVDPNRDSPERLRQFVGSYSEHFMGITGDVEEIRTLAAAVGVYFQLPPTEDREKDYFVQHSRYMTILDPEGKIFGYIKPPFSTEQLISVIRLLAATPHRSNT